MAPTLSSVPLFVRSALERNSIWHCIQKETEEDEWRLADDVSCHSISSLPPDIQVDERTEILMSVSSYLKRNIKLENVARSIRRIETKKRSRRAQPTMEVNLIVCGPQSFDASEEGRENESENQTIDTEAARMTMIRLVNRVPVLDGAEAAACGLVQAVTTEQSLWASFGLQVHPRSHKSSADEHQLFSPSFDVDDSEAVRSFLLSSSTHNEYSCNDNSANETDEETNRKRKRKEHRVQILPAHIRLGEVLIVVQINADPASLPLPTLSKVRLLQI